MVVEDEDAAPNTKEIIGVMLNKDLGNNDLMGGSEIHRGT